MNNLLDKRVCLAFEMRKSNMYINEVASLINSQVDYLTFEVDETDPLGTILKYKIN